MKYDLRRTRFDRGEELTDRDGDVWVVIDVGPPVLLCTVGGCAHPEEKTLGCRETVSQVRSWYGPLETY
ncbi:hypothetical protein ABZ543_08375 [Streptomyces roseifaciens]